MANRKTENPAGRDSERATDGNIWQRFWNNAWVRYQRKRIVAKFGGFKKGSVGGKWDRRRILSAVSALIVLVALCGLLFTFLEYRKSDRIYGKAEADFVTVLNSAELSQGQANGTNGSGNGDNGADTGGADMRITDGNTGNGIDTDGNAADGSAGTAGIQKAWYEQISVDLEGLQTAYPDAAGWIYFENESISYPVMYSGDNEKYLRTAYTGKAANAGSIFLDGEGSKDFSDPHTLIYGHNMKNLSMFGRLRYYRTEKDYYEGHKYFQIFTGGYIYRYEIFAYGQVPADSSIYYVYGADPDGEKLKALIRELKQISLQDTGVDVGPSDHILTLSTCTGNDSSRMIVSAVRVDEYIR